LDNPESRPRKILNLKQVNEILLDDINFVCQQAFHHESKGGRGRVKFTGDSSVKQYLVAAAAFAATALVSTPALATVTVSGTATPTVYTGNTNLGLSMTGSPGTFSTDLNLLSPQHVDNLFTIGTPESSVEFDDLIPHAISVVFSFTNPLDASGSPLTGVTSGFYSLLGSCSAFHLTGGGNGGCGQVSWTGGPQVFSFGQGGTFSVALDNAIFATPGNANIGGTFTLLTPSVPEPATWAMMLLGFGAVGFAMRRERSKKAVLAQLA
jgi:hypothetical protein